MNDKVDVVVHVDVITEETMIFEIDRQDLEEWAGKPAEEVDEAEALDFITAGPEYGEIEERIGYGNFVDWSVRGASVGR